MAQRHTMSIKKTSRIIKKHIPNILNSDYEFNRFDKFKLENGLVCDSWVFPTEPYVGWEDISDELWQELSLKLKTEDNEILCFLSSPYWKEDSKVARYYGLGKFFDKEYEINNLDFKYEGAMPIEKEILFYGLVKVSGQNFKSILYLLSRLESGFIFTWKIEDENKLKELISELSSSLGKNSKNQANYLNLPFAINKVTKSEGVAVYINSWLETGDNYLDIFSTLE